MTAEVLDKFSALITTALGLVAALAWNTAIQNLFNILFGQVGGKLVGQFFYAIHVTFVVIFATIYVGRAAERAKKNVAVSSVAREGKRFAKREPRHQVSGRLLRADRFGADYVTLSGAISIQRRRNAAAAPIPCG